jgi:hypothetical protein
VPVVIIMIKSLRQDLKVKGGLQVG